MEFKTRRRIHDAMRRIQKSRELAKPRGSVVGRVHDAAERLRGHHPADVSGTGFVPSKGTEVEAKIGSQGNYRRCVVVKTPKHQRWVNGKRICVFFKLIFFFNVRRFTVMCDVSKKVVKRVPTSLIRQLSDEGATDVEIVGGDPVLHSGMKRKFEMCKGGEVEAQIGNSNKYRKCVVTKVHWERTRTHTHTNLASFSIVIN